MHPLFKYDRTLPPPFTAADKKQTALSKYSITTGRTVTSTLAAGLLKGANMFIDVAFDKADGAVGVPADNANAIIAEYHSSDGENMYPVRYDTTTGKTAICVRNKTDRHCTGYTISGKSGRDGAAIFFAMMPLLLTDPEFESSFDVYGEARREKFPDDKKEAYTNAAAIMCDNAYRRITGAKAVPEGMKVPFVEGSSLDMNAGKLDTGKNGIVQAVRYGKFSVFPLASTASSATVKAVIADLPAFEKGRYRLDEKRVLTSEEEKLVPVMPDYFIPAKEVLDICIHAQKSTGRNHQLRNFMLRGPAGTGKTTDAKAIAYGLGLPYMKYTCSSGTEIFDFTGSMLPVTDESTENTDEVNRCDMNIATMDAKHLNELLVDICMDPTGTYTEITGEKVEKATMQDCMNKLIANRSLPQRDSASGQSYHYVESDFIKALRHGYLVEIQEPTAIMQPGVLVGLNSLLEQEGSITLPTGEVISRHPDAVVIITTNVNYEGCRGMNQAVTDRMNRIYDVDLPKADVLAERAMKKTGFSDRNEAIRMAETVVDMADYMREQGISDGVAGVRSLLDWMESAMITGDSYEAALYTVISKATDDPIDRQTLITDFLDPKFKH